MPLSRTFRKTLVTRNALKRDISDISEIPPAISDRRLCWGPPKISHWTNELTVPENTESGRMDMNRKLVKCAFFTSVPVLAGYLVLGTGFGNVPMFILISMIGNLLNFALNLLGCYVHDLRLQCLEFFGKFYTDGGKPFRPLQFSGNYVKAKSKTV